MIGVEAYQTLMGSFAVLKNDDTKHEATHQILTNEEYSELITERNNLRAQLASEKAARKRDAENAVKAKDKAVKDIIDKANAEIEKGKGLITKANKERDDALELNRNLKRICKENANAKRGIKPKKEHSGFIVTSTSEIFEKVKEGKTINEYRAYKSIVETPYFKHQELTTKLKDDAWDDGLKTLFDSAWQDANNINYLSAVNEENKDKNFIYKLNWRTNNRGMWEIECYHTKPVKIS